MRYTILFFLCMFLASKLSNVIETISSGKSLIYFNESLAYQVGQATGLLVSTAGTLALIIWVALSPERFKNQPQHK